MKFLEVDGYFSPLLIASRWNGNFSKFQGEGNIGEEKWRRTREFRIRAVYCTRGWKLNVCGHLENHCVNVDIEDTISYLLSIITLCIDRC